MTTRLQFCHVCITRPSNLLIGRPSYMFACNVCVRVFVYFFKPWRPSHEENNSSLNCAWWWLLAEVKIIIAQLQILDLKKQVIKHLILKLLNLTKYRTMVKINANTFVDFLLITSVSSKQFKQPKAKLMGCSLTLSKKGLEMAHSSCNRMDFKWKTMIERGDVSYKHWLWWSVLPTQSNKM